MKEKNVAKKFYRERYVICRLFRYIIRLLLLMFRHYYNDIQILSTVDEINSLDGRSSFK